MVGSGLANLRQIQELRNELDQVTNNVVYLVGTGDTTTDSANFAAAVSATPSNTLTWFDFANSELQLKMQSIPIGKWISYRNGKIRLMDAVEPTTSYRITNWSASYYGVLSIGDTSTNQDSYQANGQPGWTSLGAVSFTAGQSSVTNATIASALTSALGTYPEPFAMYLDVGSDQANPNETGGCLYGQRVAVSHISGTTVYFREPLQDAVPANTWFRIMLFPWVCRVHDVDFICDDAAIDYSNPNAPHFGCCYPALSFGHVMFDVQRCNMYNLGVAAMASATGRISNVTGISFSKEIMDTAAGSVNWTDNSFGTIGIYPKRYSSDIQVSDIELTGYRHAIDPASNKNTMSNLNFTRMRVKGCYQAAINSHEGGQMHLRDCEVHTPPGTLNAALVGQTDQPYSVLLRSNGTTINGLRIFHDKDNSAGSAFAISNNGYNTKIENVYLETTNAGIECTHSVSNSPAYIRNVYGKYVHDSNAVKYKWQGGSYTEWSGSPLIMASNNSVVDVDNVYGDGWASVVQQSGTGQVKLGKNIVGTNLLTRNATASYNGNQGLLVAGTSTTRYRCLNSRNWLNSGSKGLCIPLLNLPSLNATSFTVSLRTQFPKKQRSQQNMFTLRASGVNLMQLWRTDAAINGTFPAPAGTVSAWNSSALLGDGLWHHLCWVVNYNNPTSTIVLYVDGGAAKHTSGNFSVPTLTHDTALLFRDVESSTAAQMLAPFRDFRVYTSALSSADVDKVRDNTYTTLPAYWVPCDDGHGDSVRERILGVDQKFSTYSAGMGPFWDEV